jgi:DNA polymerase-3 subunit chi
VLLAPASAPRFLTDEAERIVVLFEARDEEAMASAREAWKALRDAGAATSYWREGDEGEWVKAR